MDDGPASNSDLQVEDVVIALNNTEVEDVDDLRTRIADIAPGTEVKLKIVRDGEQKTISIELAELPDGDPTSTASNNESRISPASQIGIDVMDVSREWTRYYEAGSGVVITRVVSNSVAQEKGLRRGDLIRAVNGKRISNVGEFVSIVRQFETGQAVRFRIQRGNSQFLVGLRIPKG